jgi:glucose-1-phosphate adenylyltransferase
MIGDQVTIRGSANLKDQETDTYTIKDGIVVIKKRAIIPSGSRIG